MNLPIFISLTPAQFRRLRRGLQESLIETCLATEQTDAANRMRWVQDHPSLPETTGAENVESPEPDCFCPRCGKSPTES